MEVPNDIVLYHYSYSPFARKVTWYLSLRGIEYGQCNQPPVMPRPDLAALGVNYRRIPVMTIGRDVFCDTRLILQKLEDRFPHGALGAKTIENKAIEDLLARWTVDAGLFARASQLIPPEMPLLNDPKFTKDREDFTGRSWKKEDVIRARPEAVAHIRDAFDTLETGLLSDGRMWILGTEKPSLADIHGVWIFHWLMGMKGALPPTIISPQRFPKVYAYVDRFNKLLGELKKSNPKPVTLKGPDAARHVLGADFTDKMTRVDESDPLGLKKGDMVQVWPIDSGASCKDQGALVSLGINEVVLESQSESGGKSVRIHFPRINYRIRALGNTKL